MADALHAAGTGAAAVHLNPANMVLIHGYVLEGNYLLLGNEGMQAFNLAVVDSVTSRLGAGVYFDYINSEAHNAANVKVGDRSGYESGVALALPFGDWVSIGATPKFQSIDQPVAAGGKADGFTFDVGANVHPFQVVRFGIAATNLIEQNSTRAPRTFMLGGAVQTQSLILDFDFLYDFDSRRLFGLSDTSAARSYYLGGEYLIMERMALRVGYNHDGVLSQNLLAFGLSFVTTQAQLDFGARRGLDGPGEQSWQLGFGLRLFVLQ
jgi:hypothetical protein